MEHRAPWGKRKREETGGARGSGCSMSSGGDDEAGDFGG